MSRRATLVVGWVAALLAMAAFTSLGVWQWGRMHEKQAMLDAAEQVLARRDARPLAAAGDAARAHDYDWAAGEGRFLDAPAVLLDNQMRDGQPGVRVYRVFAPAGGATPLLVELGWLPLDAGRAMPRIERPDGAVALEGLLMPPTSGGVLRAAPQPLPDGSLLATSMDLAELAPLLGRQALAARVLRPDPAAPLGYARDLEILPNTLPPQKHLGYAVQWFALALAVLVTALLLTFRSLRRTRPEPT